MSKKVDVDKRVFVEEYLKHSNITKAAIAAGYSKTSALSMGSYLLKRDKFVIQAMEGARKAIVTSGTYNLQMAMKETDEAIAFAKETDNANAYVKAVELKTKLNGLLIEKHDHRMAGFAIVVGGINFSKNGEDDGGDLF